MVNVLYGTLFGLTSVSNQLWSQSSAGVPGRRESSDHFGEALAAGDFDGDGRVDLAVGVPDEGFEGTRVGAVNVIYGS